MPASDGSDDFVRIGGPDEGLGLLIVLFEETIDCGLKVGDRAKNAALEHALCEDGEEALDGVEPGRRGRREMKSPSRMPFEPPEDGGVLVRRVVVDDGVDRLSHSDLVLYEIEKANEFLVAM